MFVLRALIEQVTVEVIGINERMRVTFRWTGGFESQHEIIRSVGKFENLESADQIREIIIQLKHCGHCHQAVAESLNDQAFFSTAGGKFTTPIVSQLFRVSRCIVSLQN